MQLYRVYLWGFCVQKTFSMHSMLLLGGLGHALRKIVKSRYNEIEFGSNFDCNVTLVLKAICYFDLHYIYSIYDLATYTNYLLASYSVAIVIAIILKTH